MTSGEWRPFGHDKESERLYDALHDGVPPWMRKAHTGWQYEFLGLLFSGSAPEDFLHRIEQQLRCEIYVQYPGSTAGLVNAVIKHFQALGSELTLTDYILSLAPAEDVIEDLATDNQAGLFGTLNTMLADSGSKWTIGIRRPGTLGLIRRVPEGVQTATEQVTRASGHAGKTLAQAWGAAFGMDPNPKEAYRLAIEAVEDAAIPLLGFGPREKPTLGKVIQKINGTNFDAADWTLPFQREDEHYSNGQTIIAMLKTLWAGQVDRHGGNHELGAKETISPEAAESAVMLAVPLVRWFTSGSVQQQHARS
ncbi:hypothetical protein ABH924_003628 [Arthrobacter sp. GAS37]|uniref:hypothetical protein n=1 Tax=Arthrobacter sp. GAS37 TaxID=3156261 RepID=UPI0038375C19